MGDSGKTVKVMRTYLEMTDPLAFQPAFLTDDRAHVVRVRECTASFHRYLYREVGRNYHWVDRVEWSDQEILSYLAKPNLQLWVMYYDGVPAGYFELLKDTIDSIEIAYFGLLPAFIGRGLGKHLLSVAINQAWDTGVRRIWLHTCSLDDPAAMPNYLKRGFKPFKNETYVTTTATPFASTKSA